MHAPLRIHASSLLLALDYLQFLASLQVFTEGRRPEPENPFGFSERPETIDKVLMGLCGCPQSIAAFKWHGYYHQTIWQPFHARFLGHNRGDTALLLAEVDIAPLLRFSDTDLQPGLLVWDDYPEQAAVFGRFLSGLAAGRIHPRDLVEIPA